MEKRHAVILGLLILAFGLFVHGLKALRHHATDRSGIAMADVDDTPYHVTKDEMDADRMRAKANGRGRGMHMAGATSIFNKYDFSGGKVIAADAKAKEQLKKKKKKAKDKAETKVAATDDHPYYNTDKKTTKIDDTPATNNVIGTVPEAPPAAPAAGGGHPSNNTYQYWSQLILGSPSPTNVAKLVAAYKAGQVTSQVFYQVLDAMVADKNPTQEALAVNAAGETPSAQSFEFLVQVTKLTGTTTTTTGSTGSQQAQTLIAGYAAENEVGALRIVMGSYINDATTIQFATTVLLNSAETYITNRAPTAAGNGTTATAPNLATVYAGFVPVLNHVITVYANNATIEGSAQAALSLISTVVTQ